METTPRSGRNIFSRARALLSLSPLLGLLCLGLLTPAPAQAQVGSARYSSIVVNTATGAVLEADNADAPRHPASLAKLMTLYLTFQALQDHRITLNTLIPISAHCASMEPTKLGLLPGMPLVVNQAILGIVTRSANDAACALGEMLGGGSEPRFAQMMTLQAHALGMDRTHFANASGLPAPDQWTTARDLAILARDIILQYPEDYHYFSTPSFVYRGATILNHDTMLRLYPGADGMKTGFTDASGFNLVTSALRDGVRLVGVEMGAINDAQRDMQMTSLLNAGYVSMDVPIGRPRTRVAGPIRLISAARADTLIRPLAVRRAARMAHVVTAAGRPVSGPADWTVQVGVFEVQTAARRVALAARRRVAYGEPRTEPMRLRGRLAWRAELSGMTPPEAEDSCTMLSRHHVPCLVLRPEPRMLASR